MFSHIHRKVIAASVVVVVAVTGLTAAFTASAAPARTAAKKTVVVTLHDYMFNPMTVRVSPGTTVKWHWEDGSQGDHNIVPLHKKGGLLFKGTGIRTSGYYSYTFTRKGTYYYECSVHPLTMQAKIIVR